MNKQSIGDLIVCVECGADEGRLKINEKCCEDKNTVYNIDGSIVCCKCGIVEGYVNALEHFDFYEKKNNIKRSSPYKRKYHVREILDDALYEGGIEFTYTERVKIERIIELIGDVWEKLFGKRKRIMKIKYIISRIFKLMNITHPKEFGKSLRGKTRRNYSMWWELIEMSLCQKIADILES